MKLEFYPDEKLKKEVLRILSKYVDLKTHETFFFGSRVLGKSDERSDIDIGIIGPSGISREIMFHIKEDIDNLPLLYKIDVVDFKNVSDDFRKTALEHTEKINS